MKLIDLTVRRIKWRRDKVWAIRLDGACACGRNAGGCQVVGRLAGDEASCSRWAEGGRGGQLESDAAYGFMRAPGLTEHANTSKREPADRACTGKDGNQLERNKETDAWNGPKINIRIPTENGCFELSCLIMSRGMSGWQRALAAGLFG